MRVGNFCFGEGRTFIIGELSANHNGSLETAIATIRALKRAGADAVKLQTYTADTLTLDAKQEYFRISGGLWDGMTLYQLYQEAHTPWEWHAQLFQVAREEGLICFSSPFDKTAVDLLGSLQVPAYKIASFEIADLPLISYAAKQGKPMFLSTGLATIGEIQEAVEACKQAGNENIILLKCTSAYPAPLEEVNLRTIHNLKETFGVRAGLSDHTLGISVPVAAVALGAEVIEKHVILDETIGGPDSAFSLTVEEFSRMVDAIRTVEKALGSVTYELTAAVRGSRNYMRSLFVAEDIQAGERITEKNVRSVRPGQGISPKYWPEVQGKKVVHAVKKGIPLSWALIDQGEK